MELRPPLFFGVVAIEKEPSRHTRRSSPTLQLIYIYIYIYIEREREREKEREREERDRFGIKLFI